ncbi:PdxA family dehydrogenase [Domibacillus epiphyticus]|uniref:PdxA family dehydrogenase n=1 Tax=Domibacillus epiphyticus TaxID=1714355 RepID=UPI001301090B|nr:4-hydroxythreonine-4-phosphate dehydrogenase PdxA [Domibacillus epiphyticus]
MASSSKPIIAITVGDVSGIGPEIALKSLLSPATYNHCHPLLIGDANVLMHYISTFQMPLRLNIIEQVSDAAFSHGLVDVIDLAIINMDNFSFGNGNAMTGSAMIEYTKKAIALALNGEVQAVIGGPHTKSSVEKAGITFDGYPGLVAKLTGTKEEETFLMLVSGNLRVVNTTLHVSLKRALQLVNQPLIEKAIRAADSAGRQIGLPSPAIAVAGLNPHAGEGGLFGEEEQNEIIPAIKRVQKDGIHAAGPFPSDTLFAEFGKFDIYVAMYHDQAHIPIKMKALKNIVALTVGTPVLFASVGHGSAPDIAGKNMAEPTSMIQTIELLRTINVKNSLINS